MILIIIKFGELLLQISASIINGSRISNTSKLIKKSSAMPLFFNLVLLGVWKWDETTFLVFDKQLISSKKLTVVKDVIGKT